MKKRAGSSARNGDGEGGTNDVYASRIFGSRLGRPDGFGCSPVGHAVLDVLLEEGHRIRVRISAILKRDRNQCAVRETVGSCVFGYFPFVSSRGRGHDFRTLQLMCYKLRKHEDSTGERNLNKETLSRQASRPRRRYRRRVTPTRRCDQSPGACSPREKACWQ